MLSRVLIYVALFVYPIRDPVVEAVVEEAVRTGRAVDPVDLVEAVEEMVQSQVYSEQT